MSAAPTPFRERGRTVTRAEQRASCGAVTRIVPARMGRSATRTVPPALVLALRSIPAPRRRTAAFAAGSRGPVMAAVTRTTARLPVTSVRGAAVRVHPRGVVGRALGGGTTVVVALARSFPGFASAWPPSTSAVFVNAPGRVARTSMVTRADAPLAS